MIFHLIYTFVQIKVKHRTFGFACYIFHNDSFLMKTVILSDASSIFLSGPCIETLSLFNLTPWRPVYKYIVPGNRPKISSFQLPYQRHSSSADCARELCKPSKDSASTQKMFLVGGCRFFVSESSFGAIFGWCRRLSESFEPLNSSLPLPVPKLRSCKAKCDSVVLVWKSSKLAECESVK